jgi:hypothetical protein
MKSSCGGLARTGGSRHGRVTRTLPVGQMMRGQEPPDACPRTWGPVLQRGLGANRGSQAPWIRLDENGPVRTYGEAREDRGGRRGTSADGRIPRTWADKTAAQCAKLAAGVGSVLRHVLCPVSRVMGNERIFDQIVIDLQRAGEHRRCSHCPGAGRARCRFPFRGTDSAGRDFRSAHELHHPASRTPRARRLYSGLPREC